MTDVKKVTAWTTRDGYVRVSIPEEFQRYDTALDEINWCDRAREASGWENLDNQFDQLDTCNVEAFRHKDARSIFVDVGGTDCGLSTIFVAAEDADAFMATEYLLMVQRAKAVQQQDALKMIEKAFLAFVRHGHGRGTISEFGATLDEQANDRECLKAQEAQRKRG